MSTFIKHSWNGYTIEVLPIDRIRRLGNWISRRFTLPYYTGKSVMFDVLLTPPNKQAEPLSYEWLLFDAEDRPITNTNELMSIGDGIISYPKKNPIYPVHGDMYRHLFGYRFRKIHGVDLGLMTRVGNYTLKMRVSNKHGASEYLTYVIFDLLSWDKVLQEIGIAILAGVAGGVLVAIILGVLQNGM